MTDRQVKVPKLSQITKEGIDERPIDEVRGALLVSLGYRHHYTYLINDALNSAYAWITGNYLFDRGNRSLWERQEIVENIASVANLGEVNNGRLTHDQTRKLAKTLKEMQDSRHWT